VLKTRISARIAGEYWLGNVHIVYPGASLGVVEVDPSSTDADSALRAADVEMYQDKKGKAKHAFSLWIKPVHSTALCKPRQVMV
jgi:diguanylate cyclase